MKTYGRKTIYANYTEDELLISDTNKLFNIVCDILKNSRDLHDLNRTETIYLINYYKGRQDIIDKTKKFRDDINHKVIENWAYAHIDFKKGWLLGKPIQYSLQGSRSSNEITALNNYCNYVNKKTKDQFIYEDMLIAGRGFRFIDVLEDEDVLSPFDVVNVDVENCEVVYSSGIKHEQLLSYVETSKKYIYTDDTGKEKERSYREYTVYTRNYTFFIDDKSGELRNVREPIPNILKEHRIVEYYLNRQRISLIEIGKDLFDDINYIESLDMDDMEQFVNAIMVFINAETTESSIAEVKELGAVSIASTSDKPADIKLLEQRLNAESTNSFYSRLINALHQILGIPKAGDSGQVSYGDTGQARLTGQGYTSAGIRATNDESTFEMCDFNCLKTILKICREKESKIKKLKIADIKANFQRDMSDNLLTKVQALETLYSSNVPREIANVIVGLFPDPNTVTSLQNEIFGKEGEQDSVISEKNSQTTQKIQEQNNKIQDIQEKDKQGT